MLQGEAAMARACRRRAWTIIRAAAENRRAQRLRHAVQLGRAIAKDKSLKSIEMLRLEVEGDVAETNGAYEWLPKIADVFGSIWGCRDVQGRAELFDLLARFATCDVQISETELGQAIRKLGVKQRLYDGLPC